jgi:hypothetical protein
LFAKFCCSQQLTCDKLLTVAWSEWTQLVAYGALAAGVLFLIWSLVRGSVSVLGLAFLIAGLLLELLVWFIS